MLNFLGINIFPVCIMEQKIKKMSWMDMESSKPLI